MQTDDPARNAYYVPTGHEVLNSPLGPKFIADHFVSGRPVPFKNRTDRMLLDFNNEYPTVVEYSHRALANVINTRRWDLLRALVPAVDRAKRRGLRTRIDFLEAHEVHCTSLAPPSAELALSLLASFRQSYELKRRFRNSLNDLLVLAVAATSNTRLQTTDKVLAEFAASNLAATIAQGETLSIDFSGPPVARKVSRGIKGYVNNSWRLA